MISIVHMLNSYKVIRSNLIGDLTEPIVYRDKIHRGLFFVTILRIHYGVLCESISQLKCHFQNLDVGTIIHHNCNHQILFSNDFQMFSFIVELTSTDQ